MRVLMHAYEALKKLPPHSDSDAELKLAVGSLQCCNAFEAETNDTLAEIQKKFVILATPSSKGSSDSKPGTAPSTVGSAPPTGSLAELRTLSHIKGTAGLVHSRIADKSDFKSLRQEIVNILRPVKDLVKVLDGRHTTVRSRLSAFAKNPLQSPEKSGSQKLAMPPVLTITSDRIHPLLKLSMAAAQKFKPYFTAQDSEPLLLKFLICLTM